jgi:hypothetical protein
MACLLGSLICGKNYGAARKINPTFLVPVLPGGFHPWCELGLASTLESRQTGLVVIQIKPDRRF